MNGEKNIRGVKDLDKNTGITALKDGDRVSVAGGGPAGSFFAIHLLRTAKEVGRNIAVTLIEKNAVQEQEGWRIRGCNCCSGTVSPGLHEAMQRIGIEIPPQLICQEFTHVWIHGQWKNFPLRIPSGQKMYSVFRGTLPDDREDSSGGFDNVLLRKAMAEGTSLTAGEVRNIRYSLSRKPLLSVKLCSGDTYTTESDFAVLCPGLPSCSERSYTENRLFQSFSEINPFFRPPAVRRVLIFELRPGRDYLRKYMDREMYLIESGSKKMKLEHISLVPKGEYLTVALAGNSIDKASFPKDTGELIDRFLSLPHIRAILPRITRQNTPVVCTCTPFMAVKPAKEPFADRMAVIGDALGARLYRDGLYSAFVTARSLAETLMHRGTDRKNLSTGYGPAVAWLEKDNRCGQRVFGTIRLALRYPLLSRIFYQSFATEMKFKESHRWPLGNVLRKTGTASPDYAEVCRELFSVPVFRSVLTGVYRTFRNILTETAFGISWEGYGRYPTVILKEKRDYFKKSIAAPLGIKLDTAPEMERMYAVKIRASSRIIFEELTKFGDKDGKFLKIRFVDVRRISGEPGQENAVIQYRLRLFPVSMNLRVVRSIHGRTLLYDVEELFAQQGKLLFDIAPTKDGNSRLVIYTAFNFIKGKSFLGRIFRKLFRRIFPEYAHDVVWNHAICCIKAEAERREAVLY